MCGSPQVAKGYFSIQAKSWQLACSAVAIWCSELPRASWRWSETAGRTETINWGGNRPPGLREGAEAITGPFCPVDADTQMGRAAASLREGAEGIEAPAAVIDRLNRGSNELRQGA